MEIIEGFNDTYKIDIGILSDSIIKITFTDTSYFKGKSVDVPINLNKKIRDLNH